jgi:FkbM family methyltransferase
LKGLHPGRVIFDIGANHGAKTEIFLALGARVIAVEPDELNQRVLAEKFHRLRVRRRPVTIVGKAVSSETATLTMWIDTPGSAKNTLSHKWVDTLREDRTRFGHQLQFAERKQVQSVTLEELIAAHGEPFYVKIDVEGYEPTVLRGLRRPVPYVSFEVNLPEFRPEGLECVTILGKLAPLGRFNLAADLADGLLSTRWYEYPEFIRVLENCEEKSIEVFWTTVNGAPS